MSDIFALDPQGNQDAASRAASNMIDLSADTPPGFFTGMAQSIGQGFMRGGARAADFMQTVGALLDPPGTDKEWVDKTADEIRNQSIDYWTPKPGEVGTAGRVLGGLGEIVLPLMAGGGNPSLLLGTTAIETGKDLVNAGVDATTAATVGTTEALATGLGFKIPIFGNSLPTRLATGAAGNLALGTATRKLNQQILDRGGFTDQASQFNTTGESLSVDALSGLLFGGMHHSSVRGDAVNPKLPQAAVDAILTARNAKNFQDTTAPGAPDSYDASIAHQDAIKTALEQLSRNEPVNVGDVVAQHEGAALSPDGRTQEAVKAAQQVVDTVPEDARPASNVEIDGNQVTVRSENGTTEARIRGGDTLQVIDTQTAPEAQGRGEGTARMDELAALAKERGLTLVSDTKVSESAARMYDRLERRGYEVTRNDASPDGEGNLVSNNGRPVFEVRPPAKDGPSLKKGMVRMYHGGEPGDAAGPLWFTTDRKYAEGYAQKSSAGVHYVDVPESSPYVNNPDWPDQGIKQGFTFSHELPAEIASKRQRLTSAIDTAAHEAATSPHSDVPEPSTDQSAATSAKAETTTPEIQSLRELAAQHPDAVIHSGYDESGEPVKTTVAAEADKIQSEYEQELNDGKAYEAAILCFFGNGS